MEAGLAGTASRLAHTIWTERNRPQLRNEEQYRIAANTAQAASVLRYEVVLKHGGIYLDCDFECLRNIEPLLASVDAFVGDEGVRERDGSGRGEVGTAILGAVPGHPWLADVVAALPASWEAHAWQVDQSGPGLVTGVTWGRDDVTIFPASVFYPTQWDPGTGEASPVVRPESYAVHHFEGSWLSSAAEVMHTEQAINRTIPSGSRILLIAGKLPPVELPQMAQVHRFYYRGDEWWGYPSDSAEAIRALEEVLSFDIDWVVLHRWAFWWLSKYPEFCAHLGSISSGVEHDPWLKAFRLAK